MTISEFNKKRGVTLADINKAKSIFLTNKKDLVKTKKQTKNKKQK